MAINRFQQLIAPERFNPLSFQELAFAPIALREREDALLNQSDVLLNELNNISVPDIYQEEFDREKQGFITDIENLSNKITKEGAGNLNLLGDFRNLRNRFNKSISTSGNIGRAALADANIKATRDQFYKFAIEQGWGTNPDLINQKWQEELNKFKQSLPQDLNKFSGQLPEMLPAYAPKNIDLSDEMIKLQKLVGNAKKSVGSFSFKPVRNAQGEIVNYAIINTKGEEITNNKNLESLKSYMQNRILDPSSDLNAVLQFRGVSPENYLNQVDELIDVMQVSSKAQASQYAGQTAVLSPQTKTSGRGASNKDNREARLIKMSNGMRNLVGTQTSKNISQEIENIKRDPAITPEEKNRRITTLNHAQKKRKQLESSSEYRNKINTSIKDNSTLKELGITNLDEYNIFINNPSNQERETRIVSAGVGAPGQEITTPSNADIATREFEEINQKLPNNLLASSDYYSLGYDIMDQKLAKILNEGLHNINLKDMSARGLLSIKNIDSGGFDNIPVQNFEEFNLDIQNAEKVDYKLEGIETGGIAGRPALVYNVKAKVGDAIANYSMSIDLENNDFTDQILDPNSSLYQSLDSSGKLVLDQVRDNIQFSGVATDLNVSEAFDNQGSNSIVSHSIIRDNQLGLHAKSSQDPVNKYKFINPNENVTYATVVNDDNSYSTYKKDKKTGEVTFMTIQDYFRKMMAAGVKQTNPNVSLNLIDKEIENQYKVDFIKMLSSSTFNLDNPEELSSIYSKNKQYADALKSYFNAVNDTDLSEAEKRAEAINTFNKIANLRLHSKNIKQVL